MSEIKWKEDWRNSIYNLSKKEVVKLYLLVVLVISLVTAVVSMNKLDVRDWVDLNRVPEFILKDGRLESEPFNDKIKGLNVVVNTKESWSLEELKKTNKEGIWIDSDKVLIRIKDDHIWTEDKIYFKDLKEVELTKRDIVKLYHNMDKILWTIGAIVAVAVFILYGIGYVIKALLISIVVYGIYKWFLRKEIKYEDIFRVSIVISSIVLFILLIIGTIGDLTGLMGLDDLPTGKIMTVLTVLGTMLVIQKIINDQAWKKYLELYGNKTENNVEREQEENDNKELKLNQKENKMNNEDVADEDKKDKEQNELKNPDIDEYHQDNIGNGSNEVEKRKNEETGENVTGEKEKS